MKLAIRLVVFMIFYFISTASSQIFADEKNISGIEIEEDNSISGHKLSGQSYIRVIIDHIFISRKNNSLEVSEIVVFRNEGTEIYIHDNHTFFVISTPQEITNIKTDVMECCLVEKEGVVLVDLMKPMMPGDSFEMRISYTLSTQGSEYVFKKDVIYNTTSLTIFVNKNSGISVEGASKLTLQGDEFEVISFKHLKIGETVSIPIQMIEESSKLYAGIGLIFLFSMVYIFRKKIMRKEYTLEELELEKKKIFQAIHAFEKHAGGEQSDEYRRLMEEYKQKAIQIFIKIDKIKNKNQQEFFRNKGKLKMQS